MYESVIGATAIMVYQHKLGHISIFSPILLLLQFDLKVRDIYLYTIRDLADIIIYRRPRYICISLQYAIYE